MDTWVTQMSRRRCLRQLVAWGLALAAAVALLAMNARYVNNFLLGPFEFGRAQLDSTADADAAPRYFVRVAGRPAPDAGIKEPTLRTYSFNTAINHYALENNLYALDVGGRLLVVMSPSGMPLTVEGSLRPMPPVVNEYIFDTDTMQASRSRFYPFYLDATTFRTEGYIGMSAGLVFICLLAYFAIPAWRCFTDPATHKAAVRVASWGDPVAVSAEIEDEFSRPRFKCWGGWRLTDNYLIRSSFFTFDVLHFDDLLWAYRHTRTYGAHYGLIAHYPAGLLLIKDHTVRLFWNDGTAIVSGSEKKMDKVLRYVAARTPWAASGYSRKLAGMWKKNRQDLIVAVDQHRQQFFARENQQDLEEPVPPCA